MLGREVRTVNPSARKNVDQNGRVSQNASTRGMPMVTPASGRTGVTGRSLNSSCSRSSYRFATERPSVRSRRRRRTSSSRGSPTISPRGHRLPVTKTLPSEKVTSVRLHLLAQKGQRTLDVLIVGERLERVEPDERALRAARALGAAFREERAAERPHEPGVGGADHVAPRCSSSARKHRVVAERAALRDDARPSESRFDTRMTLVNTFSMMERHNPAMMSSGDFPLRCSVTMLLFMNTVQRLPSSAGRAERNAASAMPSTGMRSVEAKFSKNEPQPDEQASFTTMSVMTPPTLR